ncbi:hypothetical protein [Patulibacter minatonensis]|uniref:hypothetical protein n=1 Tax=Patulibacter minatonensis TaxID=298163 RepID=UPI000478DE95|nr:hypothetical protein [Patulibacter minatonensis]
MSSSTAPRADIAHLDPAPPVPDGTSLGPRRTGRLLVAGAATLAAAACATPAGAAGFGAPRTLSPVGQTADEPSIAVASTGRTAVVWLQRDRALRHPRYVAAIGPSPARLGRPTTVRAAAPAAVDVEGVDLTALPGGRFALCLRRVESRRRRVALGCAFASPSGGFGPMRVVTTMPAKDAPELLTTPRADGTLAVVVLRRSGAGRRALRSGVLRPSGTLVGWRALATIRTSAFPSVDLASADDGTVAVAWTDPVGSSRFSTERRPVLRLMAPGTDAFAAPTAFSPDTTIDSEIGLQSGRDLLVSFATGGQGDDATTRIVRRRADGTFDAPLGLPRAAKDAAFGPVVQLADGTPLAVTASGHQSDTDCDDVSASIVGAGPLVPFDAGITAERLSTPGQIALDPTAGTLRDGTVIAAWRDSEGDPSRLEVAVRAPDGTSFATPRVLPVQVARNFSLATGGRHAALAWLTGNRLEGPAHVVVSAFRTAAPYAPAGARPTHPGAPCS